MNITVPQSYLSFLLFLEHTLSFSAFFFLFLFKSLELTFFHGVDFNEDLAINVLLHVMMNLTVSLTESKVTWGIWPLAKAVKIIPMVSTNLRRSVQCGQNCYLIRDVGLPKRQRSSAVVFVSLLFLCGCNGMSSLQFPAGIDCHSH